MNENIFRILAALILFTGMGISTYFRLKADKETGEKVSRKVDGSAMMNIIRFGGLILWLSPLVYLINPNWMNWSKIGLPESIRWLGVGIGILCALGIYWLFSSPKGSFNALIYMHRYRPDTVSVVLNEYLRDFQNKLAAHRSHLERVSISAASTLSLIHISEPTRPY